MTPENKTHSRLQTLELQGYKTFATKTKFEFAPTITAIVGPNGSGKSNIADAIRWVLGEQAYSLLRGKKTEDMIFSGSEIRARAGMAYANIGFDNTEGWLPIDFNEVSVGRRAYRDGQNEYLVNDQKVRLRDVTELLAESGLAERTYTIIGQGLVDTALSLRAEERRELFEEAAGIGLYRNRREEAVRRLETTRRNLERVQDILAELRPRLRSLERQAQRARDYEQVKEDLKSSLRIWYGFHWNRMQNTVSQANQTAQEQAKERGELHQEQDKVDKDLAATRARIEQLRDQLQTWSGEAGKLYNRRQELGRQQAILEERLRWLQEQRSMLESEMESLQTELLTAKKSAEVAREEMEERTKIVRELEEQGGGDGSGQFAFKDRREREAEATRLRKELEDLAGRQAAWSTREQQLAERRAELKDRLRQQENQLIEAQSEFDQLTETWNEEKKAASKLNEEIEASQQALDKLDTRRLKLKDSVKKKESGLQKLERQADRIQSRLAALRQMTEGSQAGSQALLQAAERGELAGIAGRLLSRLQVPSEYRRAISTALGELVGALAINGSRELEQALNFLAKGSPGGRTVLLPMEDVAEAELADPPQGSGVLGNAAEVVSPPSELDTVIRRLLGNTWIVRDRQVAGRLRSQLGSEVQLVTLAGELYLPTGAVIVGPPSFGPDREAREKLENELQSLKQDLASSAEELEQLQLDHEQVLGQQELLAQEVNQRQAEREQAQEALRATDIERRAAQAQLANHQSRLDELEAENERLQQQWEQLLSEGEAFDEQRARLERSLDRVQRQREPDEAGSSDELELAWQRARDSLAQAESRWSDRRERVDSLESELKTWQVRLESNQSEVASKGAELAEVKQEAGQVEAALSERQEELDPVEEELKQAEQRRADLEKAESRLRFQLQAVENRHSQAQVELARREEELLGLQRRIEDDFGLVAYEYDESTTGQEPLPLKGLVERLPAVVELPEGIETQVKRLRAQLRRMGSINPEAQQEYVHVRDRMEFMTGQVDDLREAESQMQEVIAELDVIMAREFRKTFEAVAIAFKETFQQLFGGGSARLTLTDPDDPNESGIEIEARLPGKREQGLAVLSGGERSLTASALIFALLKVSPTPFCVLDEVDAMLDESNVVRFCDLLKELSANTQFIVITHNRETVQIAQAVYGITMEADSTSRIISLDLEEAAREVAA